MRSPFDDLPSHGDRPALVGPRDAVSFARLHSQARALAREIGATPQLVFLEAANTVEAITAYVACVLGRHPVYLFAAQDRDRALALGERFHPNAILDTSTGSFGLRRLHGEPLALHPQLCVLLSTSGSTGSPKLVKLTARNLEANAASIIEYLRLDAGERAITSLKFNYSYGLSVVNSHLACGGSLLLSEDSILDDSFWEAFVGGAATSLAGVPYTFETLARSGDRRYLTPHLRYMTQAGGRLSADLVRQFAATSAAEGWRFYVMYGQTEAAPRIAWLPPEQAREHADCIGIAVPGGRMLLLDEEGREIEGPDTPGELAYSGPNVMLGYATAREELVGDETPPRLLTGDIAVRTAEGLYRITGRRSRFVKPFGVRINLDDVEAAVRRSLPGAVCAGVDERIVIAIADGEDREAATGIAAAMAAAYGLPQSAVQLLPLEGPMPRLSNGKLDLQAVARLAREFVPARQEASPRSGVGLARGLSILFSVAYLRQVITELRQMIGIRSGSGAGVVGIFTALFPERDVEPASTFVGLAGNSLSYVEASLALEDYLGFLPPEWERMTLAELEQARGAA